MVMRTLQDARTRAARPLRRRYDACVVHGRLCRQRAHAGTPIDRPISVCFFNSKNEKKGLVARCGGQRFTVGTVNASILQEKVNRWKHGTEHFFLANVTREALGAGGWSRTLSVPCECATRARPCTLPEKRGSLPAFSDKGREGRELTLWDWSRKVHPLTNLMEAAHFCTSPSSTPVVFTSHFQRYL